MKKILFLLIFPFLFLTSVNADCVDLLDTDSPYWIKTASSSNRFSFSDNNSSNFYFQIQPNVQYTFWFDDYDSPPVFNSIIKELFSQIRFNGQQTNNTWVSPIFAQQIDNSSSTYTFTGITGSDFKPFTRVFLNIWSQYNVSSYSSPFIDDIMHVPHLVEGTTTCNTNPLPPEPEPPIYSSFLTLYFDRISYLASGFTTNPYLLSMLGIIFAFIVLELFLHIIHLKVGYKK